MTHYYDEPLNDETFKIIISTCVSSTLSSLNDPKRFNTRARTIGNNIYDMSPILSGKISVGSILAKQKTIEHFNGRQEGGIEILKYVKRQLIAGRSLNVKFVKSLVDKHRQVHYTSAEENTKLAVIAKKNPLLQKNWKKMYRICGIKLIKYVKHRRYEDYSV